MKTLKLYIIALVALCCAPRVMAEGVSAEFSGEYKSEIQTDFTDNAAWLNFLRLQADLKLTDNFGFQIVTLSASNTGGASFVDDLQGFSNIEAGNIPLTLAVLGAEFDFGNSHLCVGIRNVNEDYFATPITSVFTGSSCGIFPTLSANYDIANYPLASWCVHYAHHWDELELNASLYSGQGYNRLAGHDNVFTFKPKDDGGFFITSLAYDHDDSNYTAGCAVYYGNRAGVPAGGAGSADRKVSVTPWVSVEQRIGGDFHLMLQASASTVKDGCRNYAAVSGRYDFKKVEVAALANFTDFADAHEFDTEVTCIVPLTDRISLQPALHLIHTSGDFTAAGLLRLSVEL